MHEKLVETEGLCREYEDEIAQLNQENRALLSGLQEKESEAQSFKAKAEAYEKVIKSLYGSEEGLKTLLRELKGAREFLPRNSKVQSVPNYTSKPKYLHKINIEGRNDIEKKVPEQ